MRASFQAVSVMPFADDMGNGTYNALYGMSGIIGGNADIVAFLNVVGIVLGHYPLIGQCVDECCHSPIRNQVV